MTGHTEGVEVETNSAPAGTPRGMTLLFAFAVAGAAAVGNLYWARPLLSMD
jgi:hypothetical protein